MKKVHNILYITDNYLYLKNIKYKDIIKYKIGSNIIVNSKIANIPNFIKAYTKLLEKYKINNHILGDSILIVINSLYTKADMTMLTNIFCSLNYNKVLFNTEEKYFKLNTDNAYLNITDNYMILTYMDYYKKNHTLLIPNTLFDTLNDTMDYLSKKLKHKELFIIGSGDTFQEIFNFFEDKYKIKTYMFTDHEYYIMNKIIKNFSK